MAAHNVPARLRKMLEHHEQTAAAIRLTLGLLDGEAKAAKTNGHSTVLADAIAIEHTRTAAKATKHRKTKVNVRAQRERSATILTMFTTKRKATDVAQELGVDQRQMGLAMLSHHGYLKRYKNGEYVRTAKEFVVGK